MSAPEFVTLDHAGLVARVRPRGRDYGWWLFMVGMFGVWTAVMCLGTSIDGLSCTVAAMWLGVPFLGFLSVGMGVSLATRRELRLAADGVTVTLRRFGVPRRFHFPLRELQIAPYHSHGGKGSTVVGLDLTAPGRSVRFPLPGGLHLPERDQAMAELDWMVTTLEGAVRAARARPVASQDDSELRGALQALVALFEADAPS